MNRDVSAIGPILASLPDSKQETHLLCRAARAIVYDPATQRLRHVSIYNGLTLSACLEKRRLLQTWDVSYEPVPVIGRDKLSE